MPNIPRTIQKNIQDWLFQGQVIVLYGPRQVGKTTLVKEIQSQYPENSLYLNCDEIGVRTNLSLESSIELGNYIGKPRLLIIDEAQRIKNIGLVLKLIHDNYPEIQIIATGSSSLDLANKINEPLTGRTITFTLYPISMQELSSVYSRPQLLEIKNNVLRFGSYPGVFGISDIQKPQYLANLQNSYLFKDLFELENILKPDILIKLLKLLAFQIGQIVSINELSKTLQVDNKTVERYLDLLKKTFILTELSSYSTNLRNELHRAKKYYFNDLGIRNSLIENHTNMDLRTDVGGLWENFLVIERIKHQNTQSLSTQGYFWRNYSQQEIDYIEVKQNQIKAWEFKWSQTKKAKFPNDFIQHYGHENIQTINQTNFLEFVGIR